MSSWYWFFKRDTVESGKCLGSMYLYRIRFTGEGFSNLCCLLLVLIIKPFYVQKSLFYYCAQIYFSGLCFPPEFPLHIVDLFFDCLEYPVSLSSFRHLVMFVRLGGFFLLPEDFIFTYPTPSMDITFRWFSLVVNQVFVKPRIFVRMRTIDLERRVILQNTWHERIWHL